MNSLVKKIWMTVSTCPPIRVALDVLGVKVCLSYLYVEKLAFADLSRIDEKFAQYETGFLGPDDMPLVAEMLGGSADPSVFRRRLQSGNLCCGMKFRGKLVACTWASLEKCSDALLGFPLLPGEAYLFDAFTRPSHRGRGMAPYIRWQTYKALEKRNLVNLFSYSEYFNEPAVRFKKKLNARVISLRLYVLLLNRFRFSLPLKNFFEPTR